MKHPNPHAQHSNSTLKIGVGLPLNIDIMAIDVSRSDGWSPLTTWAEPIFSTMDCNVRHLFPVPALDSSRFH